MYCLHLSFPMMWSNYSIKISYRLSIVTADCFNIANLKLTMLEN